MDYYKKYLKYKAKYFQLKSLTKYNVEISEKNTLGIVEFDLLDKTNIYEIKGIISCIGIVIRSYEVVNEYTINVVAGKAVHLVHTIDDKKGHFIDKPNGENKESILTDMGEKVIKVFENFITENTENTNYKIQLDLITGSTLNPKLHQSTQFMVGVLKERFKNFAGKNENFSIKHHTSSSNIKIIPTESYF